MNKLDLISSFFLLVLALMISILSYKMKLGLWSNPGPGFFPFCAGIVLGAVSLIILVRCLLSSSGGKDRLWPPKGAIKNIVFVIAALFFYVAFLENIGFSICTFLAMVFYVRVIGSQKWISAVLFAVITTLISYMLFEMVLKAQLPPGFLGNYNIWIF